MNPDRLEEEITNIFPTDKDFVKIEEIMGIYIIYRQTEKSVSNVLVSAAVTSKARIKLYNGILNVENIGGRVIYTDTDSIIAAFKKNSYKHALDIPLGEVIFDTNKKDTIIKDAVFCMPKTYGLIYNDNTEIVKIKGFNVKPNFSEFKNCFYNNICIETINNQ
jgi:hypothetical protein